ARSVHTGLLPLPRRAAQLGPVLPHPARAAAPVQAIPARPRAASVQPARRARPTPLQAAESPGNLPASLAMPAPGLSFPLPRDPPAAAHPARPANHPADALRDRPGSPARPAAVLPPARRRPARRRHAPRDRSTRQTPAAPAQPLRRRRRHALRQESDALPDRWE